MAIGARPASGTPAVTATSHASSSDPTAPPEPAAIGQPGSGGTVAIAELSRTIAQKREALQTEPPHRPLTDGPPCPAEASKDRHQSRPSESMQQQVREQCAWPTEQIYRLGIGRVVERRVVRIEAGERQEQRQSSAEQSEPAHVRNALFQVVNRPTGKMVSVPVRIMTSLGRALKDTQL